VQDLFTQLDAMHAALVDPDTTTVRLVLNPEKMVIREAQRTYTYLNLFGYPTDLVVCNRVLPAAVQDAYFSAWKESQTTYRRQVEENFAPLPIVDVPLFGKEIVGLQSLAEMAQAIYGDSDPTDIRYRGRTVVTEQVDGEYVMKLRLPFADKGEIRLLTSGDELVVHVGSQKRNVILPRALVGLPTKGARFEDDVLAVRFSRTEDHASR
jgi:arsenite-transporting ATPase